ncbi:bifunctional aspartate kinase/homoserine dehydrogenase I [Chiayiivirga flava]|uniref:Bifunctional aspartokinase/homoserine dehydrogenase n=1 Tax=Chiayiivirga flava TaxID=659595 RepID=A0A7W8G174_9GAMM|nr:bifunctional aspartate kinase/homoserine dehydrogenase I [Chiayiivirga flava]MBB5208568.1 aspartokinase/homoserine dehydrogenase 1 [Chiayiivirga flava]
MSALDPAPSPQHAAVLSLATTVAHKFGGSSLASAQRYAHVAGLLRGRDDAVQVTVVSAMQGVTDALIALGDAAVAGEDWQPHWDALHEKHRTAAATLLGTHADITLAWLDAQFQDLHAILAALTLLGASGEPALARVHGLGEVWSARLLADALRAAGDDVAVLDARNVMEVGRNELGVVVDWDASARRLAAWRHEHPQARVVVTGFVARDAKGAATTLGRNGSDFSGAIFAALFEAAELHIWTDVDGVLSADPRAVPDAVYLPKLSYDEACELAYFGAKVIHPQTMAPAIARGLPIVIRNTFNPAHPGTRIDAAGDTAALLPAKGLSLVSDLALLNVEGSGMIGVPGTAERVFATLHASNVSVVMISQGSSEHSICCVVRAAQAQTGRAALERAFAPELAQGQIQKVTLEAGISVLAAVGDGMAGTPGVAARFLGALARARVNLRAIAQGASERNISVAIAAADATRALRAAHAGFWLSPQTISLGVIGPGKVGAALLDQIAQSAPRLLRDTNLDLRLRGIADSRRAWLGEHDSGDWRAKFDAATPSDLDAFVAHVHAAHLPHAAILDCSASPAVAAKYPDWLAAGIHVITPNKQAGAGPLPHYHAIRAAAAAGGARFRYEATVGAGLPVIQTLRDLLDTGDELHSVEGIFSGTLAWLFNRYDGVLPFAQLVREAHALGYTEPDARDDLSGTDVARKLVILAREAGYALSLDDVQVESLIPPELVAVSAQEFLDRLGDFDDAMRARFAAAQAQGNVLRYVAAFDREGRAQVGLRALPASHAFAHLQLTDNIVLFSTRRYCDNPLVVQGPGAGPDVTAAGVFADLLRVATALGARV